MKVEFYHSLRTRFPYINRKYIAIHNFAEVIQLLSNHDIITVNVVKLTLQNIIFVSFVLV